MSNATDFAAVNVWGEVACFESDDEHPGYCQLLVLADCPIAIEETFENAMDYLSIKAESTCYFGQGEGKTLRYLMRVSIPNIPDIGEKQYEAWSNIVHVEYAKIALLLGTAGQEFLILVNLGSWSFSS
jgi:hypothetical protein